MAAPHITLPAALLQQAANSRERGQRCLPEIVDVAGGKQAASRNAVALPSMIPGIELIQGSAGAGGATSWEAAIASAMASTRAGSSGPAAAR